MSAPPGEMGKVNGASLTMMNFARALGPAFAGLMWAATSGIPIPGDQFLPFLLVTAGAAATQLVYIRFYHPSEK